MRVQACASAGYGIDARAKERRAKQRGWEDGARRSRFDPARLERLERCLQALEDAEAIRNLKAHYAALCDAQYDADGIAMLFTEDALWESPGLGRFEGREAIRAFFRVASGIFLFAIHYSRQWPDRGRRHGPSAMLSVYALRGGRRKSGDVACRHRSRDLRAGGWSLDVPPQALGPANERPVRDWLGPGAFRVTRLPSIGLEAD
jgi:SnoaL-like domain